MAHLATASLRTTSGGTKSQSLGDIWGANPAKVALDNCRNVTIFAPATLSLTCTVQIASVSPAADADFQNFQYNGADVTIAAGKATTIALPAAKDLRILSSAAEGAARDFIVTLQEIMN